MSSLIVLLLLLGATAWLAWQVSRRGASTNRLAPIERSIDRGDWVEAGRLAEAELASGTARLPGADAYLHYAAGRGALLGRSLDGAIEHLDHALFLVATRSQDGGAESDLVEYLPGFAADCRCFLGLAHLQRGDLARAEIILESVRGDADYNGDRWSLLRHLAVIHRASGRLTEARLSLDDALTASIDADDHAAAAETLRGLGQVDEAEGDLGGAAACYRQSLEEFRRLSERGADGNRTGFDADETIALLLLARVLAGSGAGSEAEARLTEARRQAPTDFVDMASHVAYFGSGVARMLGHAEEAARLAVEARAGYADCQRHLMAEYAGLERARALVKLGAIDEARALLAETAEGFERCGAHHEVEVTRAELAELDQR